MIGLAQAHWRKSSRSGGSGGGNCVEVAANLADVVGLRDSKDPNGPALAVDRRTWTAFVGGLKTDGIGR